MSSMLETQIEANERLIGRLLVMFGLLCSVLPSFAEEEMTPTSQRVEMHLYGGTAPPGLPSCPARFQSGVLMCHVLLQNKLHHQQNRS